MRMIITIAGVFLIMNVATFAVYGTLSAVIGLQPPSDGSAGRFFASVLLVKAGLAGGFVILYYLARETWSRRWLPYALVWWLSFAVIEVGQAIAPGYSWAEALGGILAEAIYFPLSALLCTRTLPLDGPAST